MKTINYWVIGAMMIGISAHGQEESSIPKSMVNHDSVEIGFNTYVSWQKKSAIALTVGFPSSGLEFAHNLSPKWNYRIGIAGMQISDYQTQMEVGGMPVNLLANYQALNVDALAEFHPFKNAAFKLVGGVSYFTPMKADVLIEMAEGSSYGDIEIGPDEIGTIQIEGDYSGLAGYVGLGFGRAVPKGRMGFGVDCGGYYVGAPRVKIVATKMLENTSEEEEELEENLSSYAWIPKFSFRLTYKL